MSNQLTCQRMFLAEGAASTNVLRLASAWHIEGLGRPVQLDQSQPREKQQEMRSKRRGEARECRALGIALYVLALIWCFRSHWAALSRKVISDLHFMITVIAVLSRLKWARDWELSSVFSVEDIGELENQFCWVDGGKSLSKFKSRWEKALMLRETSQC